MLQISPSFMKLYSREKDSEQAVTLHMIHIFFVYFTFKVIEITFIRLLYT
jgi:hypothetical protein